MRRSLVSKFSVGFCEVSPSKNRELWLFKMASSKILQKVVLHALRDNSKPPPTADPLPWLADPPCLALSCDGW